MDDIIPEHYRPIKVRISIRIDADVLAWLKAEGKNYQTRLNAVLRKAMLLEISKKSDTTSK